MKARRKGSVLLSGLGIVLLAVGCSEPAAVALESDPAFAAHEPVKSQGEYEGGVTISNGLPQANPAHFRADIGRGGSSRTLFQDGAEVLFESFGLLDLLGAGGVFDFSVIGTIPAAVDANTATSSVNIACPGGGVIDVVVTSQIPPGQQFLATEYAVSSGCDLSGTRLFEYVDLDVLGPGNDIFSFTGSIGTGDLVLLQTDPASSAPRSSARWRWAVERIRI